MHGVNDNDTDTAATSDPEPIKGEAEESTLIEGDDTDSPAVSRDELLTGLADDEAAG